MRITYEQNKPLHKLKIVSYQWKCGDLASHDILLINRRARVIDIYIGGKGKK